jgi:DNA-binding protein HU-beta
MNKSDLVEAVAAGMGVAKADGAKAVEAVLAAITSGLKADGKVNLAGFGVFSKKVRAARKGINPATKQPIDIPASTSCGFKPAQALKDALDG